MQQSLLYSIWLLDSDSKFWSGNETGPKTRCEGDTKRNEKEELRREWSEDFPCSQTFHNSLLPAVSSIKHFCSFILMYFLPPVFAGELAVFPIPRLQKDHPHSQATPRFHPAAVEKIFSPEFSPRLRDKILVWPGNEAIYMLQAIQNWRWERPGIEASISVFW